MSKNFLSCCVLVLVAGCVNPHTAYPVPHAAQLVKLRVLKPLNPIFHRDSGHAKFQIKIFRNSDF